MTRKDVKLSKTFKAEAAKAIFALSYFVFMYFFILLLAVLLTVACIYASFLTVQLFPHFITIVLAIGLSSVGFLVLIFLLKFIFNKKKTDASNLVEIKKAQEPKLFDLIGKLVNEVGTTFPKKVYLSTDVNASVFYDSSFWSMFLPIKKNLIIGLGLVNSVSEEELKAILAHEFGHFSQRSMKVGSYVYQINKVIFNMLYDNASYNDMVQRWGNVSGYFSFFITFTIKIIELIQDVLRECYAVVNKNYLSLSREMEFHADEIAASVTGYEPFKKALLRIALADASLNAVLNYYGNKIDDNIKSENIYLEQFHVMQVLGEVNNYTITNDLPNITLEEQNKFNKSKLVIKDQWASHPTIADRITRLEQTGFLSDAKTDTLANTLFTDPIAVQKQLTNHIFEMVHYPGEVKTNAALAFVEEYKHEIRSNSFGKIYNGYYDLKNPVEFDTQTVYLTSLDADFSALFSDEKVELVYTAVALQNDIETLKNIAERKLQLKTFDYDGRRFANKEALALIENLKSELETINEQIKRNDIRVYTYFLQLEQSQNGPKELESSYHAFFTFDSVYESKFDLYAQLFNRLQFVSETTTYEEITRNFEEVKPMEETLKQEINALLSDAALSTEIKQELRTELEKYTRETWQYFDGTVYLDEGLNLLFLAVNNYSFLLARKYFLMKKALLAYQEELQKKASSAIA